MEFGGWTFGKWLGHKSGALMNGIGAQINETAENSLAPSVTSKKMVVYEPGGRNQTPSLPVP